MFHLYGLMIGIGLLIGLWIANTQSKRHGVELTLLEDSLLWIAIPSIVGARLYHLITDWSLYVHASLYQLIAVWNGGLGYFGALIGGVVGLVFYALHQKEKNTSKTNQLTTFFTILDLLAFGAPLAQAIGRVGNYFNQELYGLPTNLPWAISINGERYHPLFAYEAIGSLSIAILINWLGWKKKLPIGKGQYACIYVALYATLRFWLEFLRIDTAHFVGGFGVLSIAQWVAIVLAIGAIIIFWLRRHADHGVPWETRTLV